MDTTESTASTSTISSPSDSHASRRERKENRGRSKGSKRSKKSSSRSPHRKSVASETDDSADSDTQSQPQHSQVHDHSSSDDLSTSQRDESGGKGKHHHRHPRRHHRSSSRHSSHEFDDPHKNEKPSHHHRRNGSKSHESLSDDDTHESSSSSLKPQSWSHHPKSSRSRYYSSSRRHLSSSSRDMNTHSPISKSSKRSSSRHRSESTGSHMRKSSDHKLARGKSSRESSVSSVSNRLETASEEIKPSISADSTTSDLRPEHHSEELSAPHHKKSKHRPTKHKSMDLLDQSIKAEEKSRRERAYKSSRTLSQDDDLSRRRNKPKIRSKSMDDSASPLEALDERIQGRGIHLRTSVRPPSSSSLNNRHHHHRDRKYAEKMGHKSSSSVDESEFSSDDDHSLDNGSLMGDILDQRAKGKKGSSSRSKSNDRDSKRRARSPQRSGNQQVVPGAYSGSNKRRQHGKGRDEGERAKLLAASLRSDGTSIAPAGDDEKSRARALVGSSLLGAHHAVDMSGHITNSDDEKSNSKRTNGISMELEAHVIDEENPEVEAIKKENERIRREMAEENERLRQQVTSQNQRQIQDNITRGEIVVATAADDISDSETVAEDKQLRKRRRCIGLLCCFLVLLGAIAGGVVFALQSSSDVATDDTPTTSPIIGPSQSPTLVSLYDKPNEDDCQAVENGELVDGQESMIDFSVIVGFEIVLNRDVERSEWMEELLGRLTSYLIPYLIGCYDEGGLTISSNRYIFGNGNATDYDDPETCERETELPCYAVAVRLDLSLKDNAPIASLISLLETLIGSDGSGNSLTVRLGLSDNFNNVGLDRVTNLAPTASPTAISTNAPNSSQTQSPVSSPAPTSSPIQGPSSNAPTRPPTLRPTNTGTQSPTATVIVPTKAPTLRPTLVTTPNPTLAPTRTPTTTTSLPSSAPTSMPTRGSTPAPVLVQTPAPTPNPTLAATPPPTPGPTPNPTLAATPPPTPGPTPNPTPGPTPPPTPEPTPNLAGTPSPTQTPPPTHYFAPGESCCSNNLKHCDVDALWCHESEGNCNTCNGDWIVAGSCPANGIVKFGACINNEDDCCSPATCVTISEFYKQCKTS